MKYLKVNVFENFSKEDCLVIAGDMLFEDKVLDISQVLRFFQSISAKHGGNLSIYYEMLKSERSDSRGIVELDPDTAKILKFFEKPDATQTSSRLASVVFYCLRKETLSPVSGSWP